MAPSVYDLLKAFDSQNRFDGTNYTTWVRELEMTFGEDEDLLSHIKGTSSPPSEKAQLASWTTVDTRARMAIYKTISSNPVREAHFKETTPPQSAKAVYNSLKAEYQKDSRAARFELKKRLYNPVHNPEKPVSEYIQDIIAASDALTTLGHAPSSLDVVDSTLMNLDDSFAIVRTLLTSQAAEPTLSAVKKMLTDQEDTRIALSGGAVYEAANYSRSKKETRSRSTRNHNSSDGEDRPSYDWLNPRNNDVCHRCGLPGHRSSRCIADMPQKIKDKVIQEAKDRRQKRSSSPDNSAHAARFAASDSDADSDGSTDSEEIERQHFSAYVQPLDNLDTKNHKAVAKEARAMLRRLRV